HAPGLSFEAPAPNGSPAGELEGSGRAPLEQDRAALPSNTTANLLVIPGADVDYAMVVDVVRAIASPRYWGGAAPLDLASIGRAPAVGATSRERIVVVRAADRELALLVGGAVSFRELEASRLLPLPPLLGGRPSDLVERVAFFDDQRPLLLLNPVALAAF